MPSPSTSSNPPTTSPRGDDRRQDLGRRDAHHAEETNDSTQGHELRQARVKEHQAHHDPYQGDSRPGVARSIESIQRYLRRQGYRIKPRAIEAKKMVQAETLTSRVAMAFIS